MLDRAAIGKLIPHAGAMILLDRVVSCDETAILCTTMSHRCSNNPLHREGKLLAVCGAEYGAQAAAIHGPMVSGSSKRAGQIVLLRDLTWSVPDLSGIAHPLAIRAARIHHDSHSAAYRFTISANDREVMGGECGIIFE